MPMLLHVDRKKFNIKPTGPEIGGIKARFTKAESVKDLKAVPKPLGPRRRVQKPKFKFQDTIRPQRTAHGLITGKYVETIEKQDVSGSISLYLRETRIFENHLDFSN